MRYAEIMGRLKTFCGVMSLVLSATGVSASDQVRDPLVLFANCAGRLSAEMEHAWLIEENPDEITRQRDAIVDLIDAILPPDRGREVLALRIEAKFAQAALLQRGLYAKDDGETRRALARALAARDRCLALIPQIS